MNTFSQLDTNENQVPNGSQVFAQDAQLPNTMTRIEPIVFDIDAKVSGARDAKQKKKH